MARLLRLIPNEHKDHRHDHEQDCRTPPVLWPPSRKRRTVALFSGAEHQSTSPTEAQAGPPDLPLGRTSLTSNYPPLIHHPERLSSPPDAVADSAFHEGVPYACPFRQEAAGNHGE